MTAADSIDSPCLYAVATVPRIFVGTGQRAMEFLALSGLGLAAIVALIMKASKSSRKIDRAWRSVRPLMIEAAKRAPPVLDAYAPRGINRRDDRETFRPRVAVVRSVVDRISGTRPHPLAGETFVIDYVDAQGFESRRRIRVTSVVRSRDDAPMLDAYCHERRAHRRFRIDRIQRIIDEDGVIHEPTSYLDHVAAARAAAFRPESGADAAGQGVVLLVALGRSDGRFVKAERQVVTDYVIQTAKALGFPPDDPAFASKETDFAGLRPDIEMIDAALAWVSHQDATMQRRVLNYCQLLIDADGKVLPGESETLVAIETALAKR